MIAHSHTIFLLVPVYFGCTIPGLTLRVRFHAVIPLGVIPVPAATFYSDHQFIHTAERLVSPIRPKTFVEVVTHLSRNWRRWSPREREKQLPRTRKDRDKAAPDLWPREMKPLVIDGVARAN